MLDGQDVADKKTIMNVVYKNKETDQVWAKRFIVEKFILDKTYRFLDENMILLYISNFPEVALELHFAPQARQKVKSMPFNFKDIPIKAVHTRGIRLSTHKVEKHHCIHLNEKDLLSSFPLHKPYRIFWSDT